MNEGSWERQFGPSATAASAWRPSGDAVKKPPRVYVAIIWTSDPSRSGQRVSVLAESLADAKKKLEAEHGEGTVFDLHDKDDARKPR